jgi:prepilin-type N-terminal cleavage/methylation domain-containing protein
MTSTLINPFLKPKQAFSLSELLIALAILGLVATLSGSAFFASFEKSKNKAVFQETLHIFKTVLHEAFVSENNATNWDLFSKQTNVIKSCPNNSWVEGCNITGYWYGYHGHPGLVFHNGARVNSAYFPYTGTGAQYGYFFIDINGATPPNTDGKDQAILCFNRGDTELADDNNLHTPWHGLGVGEIEPCSHHNVDGKYNWFLEP